MTRLPEIVAPDFREMLGAKMKFVTAKKLLSQKHSNKHKEVGNHSTLSEILG